MKVPRYGSKIYFYYKSDKTDVDFFQSLVFAKYKKITPPESSDMQTEGMSCKRQWISVWLPLDESNPEGAGQWKSTSVIVCKQYMDQCTGVVNEFGNCDQGGGDDGGWEYPGGSGDTEPEEEDPCKKLAKIGKSSDTKSFMNTLKGKTTDNKEHGYVLAEASGTVYEYPIEGQPGQAGISFTLGIGDKIDGYIHSHYGGLLSIFSPDDMFAIAMFLKNNSIKDFNTFVIGVVTASGTQYMMVIDDPVKFQTFADGLFIGNNFDERDLNIYKKLYNETFNIKETNSSAENETSFLHYEESSMSGLKVLKGSENMQNWQSLELDQNNNVVPTNCN